VLVQSALILFWTRLGSLHALETVKKARFWKRWLGREMSSVDTLGRVYAGLKVEGLRKGLHHVYKHEPLAIEAFLLSIFLAYNLFHGWLARNLKPSRQRGKTQVFWARRMAAELYGDPGVLPRGP